jgi:hypothetical protein
MNNLQKKKEKEKIIKQQRAAFLLYYVLFACLAVLFLRPDYIISILAVLVPPAVLNFLWLQRSRKKILNFSLAATFIFAPPVELMSRLANVWDVQSIFYRPFGLIPLENMLFAFLNFFWGLSFYEYFVDKDATRALSPRFRYLVGLFLVFASLIYSLYFIDEQLVSANYFLMAVPVLIIPAGLIFYKNPKLLKKTILPTLFFAAVFFVYEIISLEIGSWWWPGEYIFPTVINGRIFPLDDVIIWYFISTPALIGGYEYFMDDYA